MKGLDIIIMNVYTSTPHHTTPPDSLSQVTPSSLTSKVLSFSSGVIQAGVDLAIHQAILASALALSSSSLEPGYSLFLSGIIPLCYAFSSLYGWAVLFRPFSEEKLRLSRAWVLIIILTLLFAFTSEAAIPFFPVMAGLLVFMAVNFGLRYSLRHVLAKPSEAFSLFAASPACAAENPPEVPDTSLRKDYRHNMKAVLAKKSRVYLFIKRMFDVLSSGIALVILSPLLLSSKMEARCSSVPNATVKTCQLSTCTNSAQ